MLNTNGAQGELQYGKTQFKIAYKSIMQFTIIKYFPRVNNTASNKIIPEIIEWNKN